MYSTIKQMHLKIKKKIKVIRLRTWKSKQNIFYLISFQMMKRKSKFQKLFQIQRKNLIKLRQSGINGKKNMINRLKNLESYPTFLRKKMKELILLDHSLVINLQKNNFRAMYLLKNHLMVKNHLILILYNKNQEMQLAQESP